MVLNRHRRHAARARCFPAWAGFERSPEGVLLRQLVDLGAPMGVAYERSAGFFKDFHAHERFMIVCPRGACRMEVRTVGAREVFRVDARAVLLVPKGVVHDDEGTSAIYDTMALYPDDDLVAAIADETGMSPDARATLETRILLVRRSAWLDVVLERYFSERVVGTRGARGSLGLLERQILHEVAQLAFTAERGRPDEETSTPPDDLAERALVFIEGNLFEPLDVPRICAALRTSESSLLRAFHRAVGVTPLAYVRNRRLDEARSLLAAGDHQVSDVALLVGYHDVSAFTKAFAKRFGARPRPARPDRHAVSRGGAP